jgi:hypothetical protein
VDRIRVVCATAYIRDFLDSAGVSLYELARFMGTSVDQIDKTHGHLLPDSIERTRSALDAFIDESSRAEERLGHWWATKPSGYLDTKSAEPRVFEAFC